MRCIISLFFFLILLILPGYSDNLNIAADFKNKFLYDQALNSLSNQDEEQQRYSARLLFLSGKYKDSLCRYEALKNRQWYDYFYMGLVNESLGRDDAAINAYDLSLRRRRSSIAFYRLGKIYYRRKDYARAVHYFSEVVAVDKSVRLAYYYLGEAYARIPDYQKSHSYLQRAVDFYPKNKKISDDLATAKEKLGKNFFVDQHKEKELKRKEVRLPVCLPNKAFPALRVGIVKGVAEVTFKGGGDFTIIGGKNKFYGESGKFYSLARVNDNFILKDYQSGKSLHSFSSTVKVIADKHPFYIFDIAIGSGNYWHKQMDMALRGDLEFIGANKTMTLVNILSVEDYLRGVLPAEISPNSTMEVLKAQAIAARTMAFRSIGHHRKEGFDVCSDVHCQAYSGFLVETSPTNKAVDATSGKIMVYNDKPIEACYHSNCGGCLRDDAFGEKIPYIKSQRDWKDTRLAMSLYEKDLWFMNVPKESFSYNERSTYRWQRVYDEDDFFFLTGNRLSQLRDVKLSQEGPCGHYGKVELKFDSSDVVLTKDIDIRNYFDGLRSSAFRMDLQYSSKGKPHFMIIWGGGFGHGTGMSQEGAIEMGEQGYSSEAILEHYYSDAKISKMY